MQYRPVNNMTDGKEGRMTDNTSGITSGTPAPAKAGLWSRITHHFPFLQTKKGITVLVIVILVIIGGGLAGLAALPRKGGSGNDGGSSGSGGSGNSDSITSDVHFYGQSPAFYPSPNISGTGTWGASLSKAQALVNQMTLDEKISLTAGSSSDTGCVGYIAGIPRLNFPGMCLQDAGQGVRATDLVSSWPSGVHMAASFNRALSRERALGMGGEFRTKGANIFLGPVIGPMGRTVTSGRNWEGISPDPYLSGALVYETVIGVQQAGVITSTKHYIGNEQETHRQPNANRSVEAVSSNIDDQTMHELYLWPFYDAVRAGSANMMCSYQRINNSYGCANTYTLNGLLKTELGFQGFVVTDWGAQHSGVATALAGTDMAMPGDGGLWGSKLLEAVNNGSVPLTRLDDMVTRIISAWYQLGQDQDFPSPGAGIPKNLQKPHAIVDARNSSFKSTLFNGAVEGHVLVKNTNNALPLSKPKFLSVFGYSARSPAQYNIEPSSGYIWTFGAESADIQSIIQGFAGNLSFPASQIAPNGTLLCGGGSGANAASISLSPMDAILRQAYDDDTAVSYDFTSSTPYVDGSSDACLVFGNAWANEGIDRPGLHDDYTDGLIKHVADTCNNTIVIFHNAGIRLVDQFIDHQNVTGLIFAHLPGQETGRALVSLLYGQSNPSGKLPYTVARNESDYEDLVHPAQAEGEFEHFPQANFTEGVYIDYRQFDAKNVTPRYEFGYGLSYTTFSYDKLIVTKAENANTSQYPVGDIIEGGQSDLWDVLVNVTADVQNTGTVAGAEVAQLYINLPGNTPARQLRGFDKPFLNATQTATVSFELTRRDLSVWDTVAQKWLLQTGTYTVFVGSSSRDLPLNGTFSI